ncbi:MAG: sigma-70 family RNA polymerase sigma factor [Myxococcaceae bacterium]|nr:sigma-70 family RNA polymerase sigma factor [Myxococcaceae bacterium]MCI0671794.1 sigma-70 family RNA polymerase sigma factor [Myxococcaceae bacterium]
MDTAERETASPEHHFITRLRRRDPDAFEQLVRQHQDRLFDFCTRMLGDRLEAEDLVQEIFVTVHQNLGRFREDARLSTWLFRITRNHCINRLKYLRRRGRGRTEDVSDVSEAELCQAAGAPEAPDEALGAAHARAQVQSALQHLAPEQRVLVALRDIEGLSYEEIVDITGVQLGTVKSRLHRARERLATLLGSPDDGRA